MNKILLVWEESPESVSFVQLVVDDTTRDKLISFNGNLINGMDDERLQDEMLGFFYEDGVFRYNGNKMQTPITVKFDLIVHMGFIL